MKKDKNKDNLNTEDNTKKDYHNNSGSPFFELPKNKDIYEKKRELDKQKKEIADRKKEEIEKEKKEECFKEYLNTDDMFKFDFNKSEKISNSDEKDIDDYEELPTLINSPANKKMAESQKIDRSYQNNIPTNKQIAESQK